MNSIENILLYCLKQINGERTIYSIFHLFNGKKSSQTIQDAHLFSIKRFFRINEALSRDAFDEMFKRLLKNKWVEECGEQRYILSSKGVAHLQKQPMPAYINGWKYHQITSIVWERLSLLIQVTSNLAFEETRYIPIQKNKEIHLWLKAFLKKNTLPRKELGEVIFFELVDCLDEATDINPSVLVFRLTGYQVIGLTPFQSAQKLNMSEIDYHLEFINIIHFIIQMVENNRSRFKVLSSILDQLMENKTLTQSAQKTWGLLSQGFAIDQIANLRKLKQSTIEDHLVEFALHIDEFSIGPFVDSETQKKILELSSQLSTRQLKVIRSSLKTASYFQIRLVLAKYGGKQWN